MATSISVGNFIWLLYTQLLICGIYRCMTCTLTLNSSMPTIKSKDGDDLQITTKIFGRQNSKSRKGIASKIDHIWDDKGYIIAIGIASGASRQTEDCEVILKNEYHKNIRTYYSKTCNWLAVVYVTTNASNAHQASQIAKEYVENKTGTTSSIYGGVRRGGKTHYVYAIAHRHVIYEDHCLEYPRKSLSQFVGYRGSGQEVYIGTVSGPDAITAMRTRRTGCKYRECHGVNRMRAIYKSTDRRDCRNTEKRLYKYQRRPSSRKLTQIRVDKETQNEQPWSFVFISMNV